MCKQFSISSFLLVLFLLLGLGLGVAAMTGVAHNLGGRPPLWGADGFSFAAVPPKVSFPWVTTDEGCGHFVHLMGLRTPLPQRWLRTYTCWKSVIGILR